jgi:hypothetical protein
MTRGADFARSCKSAKRENTQRFTYLNLFAVLFLRYSQSSRSSRLAEIKSEHDDMRRLRYCGLEVTLEPTRTKAGKTFAYGSCGQVSRMKSQEPHSSTTNVKVSTQPPCVCPQLLPI